MKFENTEVFNFEGALRGMRNPMASWEKSDSHYCLPNECATCDYDCGDLVYWTEPYLVGEKDMALAKILVNAGAEHRKFLRQVFVSVDITAPLYWFKEFDTYKIGTTANSTSTMHKLASTPITLECFETDDYFEELNISDNSIYKSIASVIQDKDGLIDQLEKLRLKYVETKDIRYWKELIRWMPESWLQTRTVTMNYENLRNMYWQRRNHKLSEWHQFCDWVASLPYAKELIVEEEED